MVNVLIIKLQFIVISLLTNNEMLFKMFAAVNSELVLNELSVNVAHYEVSPLFFSLMFHIMLKHDFCAVLIPIFFSRS